MRYVDELVCRDRGTARHYALQDANFNVTAIIDATGGVAERYTYTPYGERTTLNASWAAAATAVDWTLGHQGLVHDGESGLVYNRARYLHPLLGRFTQRDPLGYVDGMNLYEYETSTPATALDPEGYSKGGKQNINVSGVPSNITVAELEKLIAKGGHSPAHLKKLKGLLKVKKRLEKYKGMTNNKMMAMIGLLACEAACAAGYNNCLMEAQEELEENLCAAQSSLNTADDVDAIIGNAETIYNLDAATCATKYVICGLGCLIPFGDYGY